MQKERLKENANHVGALSVRNTREKDPIAPIQKNNGITLIALIITIIVMLILVGVTVSIALKGELFKTAKDAAKRTEAERDKEIVLSNGEVEIDGLVYASMDEYIKGNPKLPEGWSVAETKPEGWTNEHITAITDGENILPLPKGFQVSLKDGENIVSDGLVIKDSRANEFVWIPVTETYTEYNLGLLTGTDSTSNCVLDSQEQLDYYYGEGYFDYDRDFNYAEDKTKIETSINKYKGFYVGRYETTIDEEGNIGSKANTPVLTAETIIKEGANSKNNEPFYYRWYGLYKIQKDMYAGNETVFSTMITYREWDKIMDFTGYGDETRGTDTYTTKPDLSGSAYSTDPNKYDVSKNIYDLAGNVFDWTSDVYYKSIRIVRGGYYDLSSNSKSNSIRYSPVDSPSDTR